MLQPYFSLAQELFAADPSATGATGPRTAQDWSRVRQLATVPGTAGPNRYGSDDGYRRYLASIHEGKLRSVNSLMSAFDFGRYPRILELGCGDMPLAYAICSRFPQVSYTATDFDPDVIESCSTVPMLAEIRKLVLDVRESALDELGRHDLVLSWSLEFCLEDKDLTRLFAACRRYKVPYLLCTHTGIGPLRYLLRARSVRRERLAANGERRMIGWLRSVGAIARLARQEGVTLLWKSYHVNHAAFFFDPTGH